MTLCFVDDCRNCPSSYVSLHLFPKSEDMVRKWLEATGEYFTNINATIQIIMAKRKQGKYRMCSAHFADNAYHLRGVSRYLKPDAVPSIFQHQLGVATLPSSMPKRQLTGIKVEVCAEMQQDLPSTAAATMSLVKESKTASAIFSPAKRKRFSDHDYTHESAAYCFGDYVSTGTNTELVTMVNQSCECKPTIWHRTTKTQTDKFPGKKNRGVSTWDLLFKRDAATWTGDDVFEVCYEVPYDDDELMKCETSTPIKLTSTFCPSLFCDLTFPISKTKLHTLVKAVSETKSSSEDSQVATDDSSYVPETDTSMDQSTIKQKQTVYEIVSDSKFIVFQSCLDQLLNLLTVCTHNGNCGAPIVEKTKSVCGTLLVVCGTCESGHKVELWRSQPMLGSKPAGNVLWSAAVLFSGSQFTKAHKMFQILGVPCIEKTTHYINQTNYLFPVVDLHYDEQYRHIINDLKDKSLCVSSDGQCDSPGHSARYCAYSVMEENSRKIIESVVVEATETTSTNSMKNVGFVRCVDRMMENGLDIGIVTTDRHINIQSTMEKKYSGIRHELDIWHYAKCLNKKLIVLCRRKNCKALAPWRIAIVKHFLASSSTSRGNVPFLIEKWNSILRHITNEHFWDDGELVHGCNHEELDDENERAHDWIDKQSFAYGQLAKLVLDKQIQQDLAHMSHFCHTGELEVFNSTVLKHRIKPAHLTKDGMIARTKLAILAHNSSVNRPKVVIKTTNEKSAKLGAVRCKPFYSKKTKKGKVVYERCQMGHVYKMMFDIGRKLNGEIDFPCLSKSANRI